MSDRLILVFTPPVSSPLFPDFPVSSNIVCSKPLFISNEASPGTIKTWRKITEADWAKEQQVEEEASYLVPSCRRGREFVMMPLNSQHLLYMEGAY